MRNKRRTFLGLLASAPVQSLVPEELITSAFDMGAFYGEFAGTKQRIVASVTVVDTIVCAQRNEEWHKS